LKTRSPFPSLPLPAAIPAVRALLALVALSLAAAPARAIDLGFDDIPDLTDAAAASLEGASVTPAQVLSESSVTTLLGFDAEGTWATSGDQGLLNSLGPTITFRFERPVLEFSIDVLGIAREGVTLPVQLLALDESGLTPVVRLDTSDPTRIGDSGQHEQRLMLGGFAFDEVTVQALTGSCSLEDCVSQVGTTFFVDSARFTFVPEPGTAVLAGIGLAALAAGRRRAGARA